MYQARLPLVVFVCALISLAGCKRENYAYEIVNDSPDSLTAVQVEDPNFAFGEIDMRPYRGGLTVSLTGKIPDSIRVRWTRVGGPPKSVRISTGLECPGRPAAKLDVVQYWIRADDSVRTRFQMDNPKGSHIDFVPCESATERTRRLANDALMAAATAGDVDALEAALEHAQVNPTGHYDPAPLHIAAAEGHLEAAEYLLQRGARIEVPQQSYMESALVVAIEKGHVEIAELLINSGADVNRVTFNSTPLGSAAEHGPRSLVKLLLDRGTDIHLVALQTPAIMKAARAGHVDIVALLLERGANPNATSGTSHTVLDAAEKFHHAAVAALLIKAGAKRGPPN